MEQSNISPGSSASTASVERRKSIRFPSSGASVVLHAGKEQYAFFAIDESTGGMGIQTDCSIALVTGQLVSLEYQGARTKGQIAGIYPLPDGGCRISISWDADDVMGNDQDEGKPFYCHRGIKIACDIIRLLGEKARVRLWDGSELEVDPKELVFRTRRARRNEILTMGKPREILMQIYGLPHEDKEPKIIRKIVEFEFGSELAVGQ